MRENVVRPERLELPTLCSEGRCSIQLSYGRVWNILRQRLEANQSWALDAKSESSCARPDSRGRLSPHSFIVAAFAQGPTVPFCLAVTLSFHFKTQIRESVRAFYLDDYGVAGFQVQHRGA
jgi:hypothetical protein